MHPHISVLLAEVLNAFAEKKISSFIDGTLGLGGHTESLLKSHPEIEQYIGIDQDNHALSYAERRLQPWSAKLQLLKGNFGDIAEITQKNHITQVDGILLDLGVSSIQLDEGSRGFSFMKDGPLDMRMNNDSDLTAELIVNTWSEQELAKIFRDFGEETQWRRAAKMIIAARHEAPLKTTRQLADILEPLVPKYKRRIHPATLVFQALRIAVNDELGVLQRVLPAALNLLKPGGRLAIISFHSLEDRIVKEYFREEASDKVSTSGYGGVFLDKTPTLKIITRKPIMPSLEEETQNPRSRSAKLRVAEKL